MTQMSTILVVDDEPIGHDVMESLLASQGYNLVFANNGPDALSKASELLPDLILLDVMMPGMDGFEVCERLRADSLLAEVPIVMVTALDDHDSRLQGIEAGADDFLSKPINKLELRARVKNITQLNRYRQLLEERANLQQAHAELAQAYSQTLEGWSRALELRDNETEGHSQRVTKMTLQLAQLMGLSEDELEHIRRGALLHDIGKMGIPDNILLKPGPLTGAEMESMRKHPVYAYDMLWPITYLRPALDIPYCHHERWDGTGYPRGLKGKEIPLAARIFAVADVWDALCSDRPYHKAWSREEVCNHIRKQSGYHFDPEVVDIFLEMIGEDDEANLFIE
jgi:putative two-component system response regulator